MPIIDMAARIPRARNPRRCFQVRRTFKLAPIENRSETGQKHQKGSTCLASHPSIHPSTSALIIATNTTTTTTTPATTTTATTTATTATTTTTTPTPTPTSTPTPTPTTGIIVSFPDRFRTAQFSFLLKYENECVHGRILLLVLLLLSVLPLAPLPLQRRYHYYTEEFLPLLFSTWQKFHGRVRNSQKPVRNRPNATSLSLSLAYSLTLLPELLRLLLFQFPLPLLLVLLLLLVHCEFSGPFPDRTSLFCSQIWNRMRSRMDPYSHY